MRIRADHQPKHGLVIWAPARARRPAQRRLHLRASTRRAFGRSSVAMPLTRCACSDTGESRQIFGVQVRDRLGRAGRLGRPRRKPFPVFGLLAPSGALRRTENPRVGGSIPPLATTPNFLKRNGFPASPADYRRAKSADHRTYMDAACFGRCLFFVMASRCGCSLISGLRLQSLALRGPDEVR